MQALMKALMSAGVKGRKLADEAGNVMRGGKEIFEGGVTRSPFGSHASAIMGPGGKSDALKKLLVANKGGAAALGGGAAGVGAAGYAAADAMDDDDEGIQGLLKKLGIG